MTRDVGSTVCLVLEGSEWRSTQCGLLLNTNNLWYWYQTGPLRGQNTSQSHQHPRLHQVKVKWRSLSLSLSLFFTKFLHINIDISVNARHFQLLIINIGPVIGLQHFYSENQLSCSYCMTTRYHSTTKNSWSSISIYSVCAVHRLYKVELVKLLVMRCYDSSGRYFDKWGGMGRFSE